MNKSKEEMYCSNGCENGNGEKMKLFTYIEDKDGILRGVCIECFNSYSQREMKGGMTNENEKW